MHYHWKKQRALDGPCTDMTGFTRLVASERGQADGLEDEMPSVFVRQYTTAEIAKYGHFGKRAPRFRTPRRGGGAAVARRGAAVARRWRGDASPHTWWFAA
jgi:hypothetical protein